MDRSVRSGRAEIVCEYSFNQAVWSAKILEVVPFDIPNSTCFALNHQYILKYWEPTSPRHRTGIFYASSVLQVILGGF